MITTPNLLSPGRRQFLQQSCAGIAALTVLGNPLQALAASQSLYQLPLTLADRLGFFRQAGVQLEWLPQESGAKALSMALPPPRCCRPYSWVRICPCTVPHSVHRSLSHSNDFLTPSNQNLWRQP